MSIHTALRRRAALSNPRAVQKYSEKIPAISKGKKFYAVAKGLWPDNTAKEWARRSGESETTFYHKSAGKRRVTGDDALVIVRELLS